VFAVYFLFLLKITIFGNEMNYQQFREGLLPFHVISISDVRKQFPMLDTRRLVEWQKKDYITKLINRHYLFTETQKSELMLLRVSNCLYKPSYVSLESALGYYHLIPESVYTIQAVTTKKTQLYETPVGAFNFRTMKPSLFFGYSILHINELPVLIAEKEKAIIDFFYLNPHVRETADIEAMRINRKEMQDIDWNKFDHYLAVFNNKALNARVNLFKLLLAGDDIK
jgi:predicted transcriptional regulator of viral defense system